MAALQSPELSASVSELLLRWQEQRAAGRCVTAEELCADCPELAGELRERVAAFESMEKLLGLGTDPATAAETPGDDDPAVPRPQPEEIPGYRLLGVLGFGGMGVVYKAQHLRLRRLVALKMCLAGRHATPEQRARFRNEAEAAASLRHPNIVQVYEVSEFRGQPYLALELVEGGSLAQRLAQSVLPVREAAELLLALAKAVAAAHKHGIIHRDLKPANVLLGNGESLPLTTHHSPLTTHHSPLTTHQPKITDFGLAKWLREDRTGSDWHTRTGAVLGTASYMAPEQAEGHGRKIGPQVDVYALGAILYEALTGRPPFKGETPLDTLDQVRTREPIAPSRLRPSVPRDLETICLKCLAKEPGRRYASAAALADDLRRFLAGEPIHARPASRTERLVKWVKRKPAVAALLFVSAVAAAGLLGGWAWFTAALHREREYARLQWLRALEQEELARLGQEEATESWRAAARQSDRADALLRQMCSAVEQHATTMIKAKGDPEATPGSVLYALARIYARDAAATDQHTNLPPEDRRRLAEQYAARAVKLLHSAAVLGYFLDAAQVQRLQQDRELESLRGRDDFGAFLRTVTEQKGDMRRDGD